MLLLPNENHQQLPNISYLVLILAFEDGKLN